MAELIGTQIDRYKIIEKLGEGGMAVVYKAYDSHIDTFVALKLIGKENIPQTSLTRAISRFEREAKSVARLTHPDIVKVTDYGEFEGNPYLVMEYLPGGTLKDLIREKGRIPWKSAIQTLTPVVEALRYAHSQGIIHRDIKPSNILFSNTGHAVLADFGIAKFLNETATMDLTGTLAVVGTPEYMAPEQAVSKSIDGRADIYSLGIVLYEAITGQRPFQADTPIGLMLMHSKTPIPRPSIKIPDLPQEVEACLIKMLAKVPDDRYTDMTALLQAWQKLIEPGDGLGTFTRRETAGTQVPSVITGGPPPLPPQLKSPKHSMKMMLILAGGGLVIGLSILLGIILPGHQDKPTDSIPYSMPTSDQSSPPAAVLPTGSADLTLEIVPTTTPESVPTLENGMQLPQPYQVSNCGVTSSLHVGDLAYVAFGGGENGLRSEPNTGTRSNILTTIREGRVVAITGGPICDAYGYLLWQVQSTYKTDWTVGWTPEVARSEGVHWLVPVPFWKPCGGQQVSHLTTGIKAYVNTIGDISNHLRDRPETNSEVLTHMLPGSSMKVLDGPDCQGGLIWWKVSSENGYTGWTAESENNDYWLIPVMKK